MRNIFCLTNLKMCLGHCLYDKRHGVCLHNDEHHLLEKNPKTNKLNFFFNVYMIRSILMLYTVNDQTEFMHKRQ